MVEVAIVEPPGLDTEHAAAVAPLAVGRLAAEAEPCEVQEDDVFRGNDVDRFGRFAGDHGRLTAGEDGAAEGRVLADEHIHLEPARQVDDVETGGTPDGVPDGLR